MTPTFSRLATMHAMVNAGIRLAADAVAIVDAAGEMTYRELDRRAAAIERWLVTAGIRRGAMVGISMPRTRDLIASMLAVLRRGAAYVPLDDTYPADRLRFMCEDSRAVVILTTAAAPPELFAGCITIGVDRIAGDDETTPLPDGHADSRDLAYLIYTSGSTGVPKGVAIEHRSAVAFLRWSRDTFTDEELGGVLGATSVCFDLSIFEIFAPLAFGGTVILAKNALQLPELAARERVRLINTVPSAMGELVRLGAVPDSVRTVCLAGEAFPLPLAQALGGCRNVRRVLNLYGPSEDTTYSTWSTVDPSSAVAPSIGVPLTGTEAYVLDEELRPVPPGEKGELYLGGEGLARGYLGRPRQTAERFVPDPFSGRPGARLYRTGDLVAMRSDGVLDFFGRLDDQVKVRGHRVELGEVTAALRTMPGVADAAVVLHGEAGTAEAELAAYVVAGEGFPAAAARAFLGERLPQWMIPSTFTRLDALPRTLNGKLDKRRLPAPRRGSVDAAREPRTETERRLATIVRDVLRCDSVDVHETFVALGGHSLAAVRVVARVRQDVGVAITVADVFAQSIAALAKTVDARTQNDESAAVAAIPRVARDEPAPLTAAQRPMWFLAQLQPDDTSYNIACVIDVRGRDLRAERLVRAMNELVRRHESLRTAFETVDGVPRQRVLPWTSFDVPVVHADDARVIATELAAMPFDLAAPPLFRARIIRIADDAYAIAFAAHHIVFDDWSIGVLVRDLAELESALAEERAPSLAPLDVQFADFAVWQSRDGVSAADVAWWKRQLAGAPPLLRLPTRRPQTEPRGTAGASVGIEIDAPLAAAARALAAREGASPYMLLLAAFAIVMRNASGQPDLIIGSAAAGRTRVETEPLIGCFINLLPMRIAVDDDVPFVELVRRVRGVTLDAFAHGDVPFARIVDELRPPRGSHSPVAQVAFGIQNAAAPRAVTPHAAWSAAELDPTEARMDLTLWLDERAGALRALWTYSTELFERADVEALHQAFVRVVRAATQAPSLAVAALRKEITTMTTESVPSKPKRFPGAVAPKAVRADDLVALERGWLGGELPLQIAPRVAGVRLVQWAESHRELVQRELHRCGGILFRGFAIDGADDFRAFARAVSSELIRYGERSSPRTEIGDGIYTSTDHPPDQPIVLHNEQSYTTNWPMKIIFYCDQPPTRMGRTPVANSRRILARLDPALVQRFEERGVLYVRNYLPGISVSWREAFQTSDRAAVERYCRDAELEAEWLAPDHLRTRQVRAAVRTHPVTGERSWFNHALFFHVTSLPRDVSASLQEVVAEEHLPYNTYYGTGERIEPETLAALRAAFDAETVSFAWQRGDVLLLDNMLSAHGREPFEGPRRILTAMTDPVAVVHGAPVAGPRAELVERSV